MNKKRGKQIRKSENKLDTAANRNLIKKKKRTTKKSNKKEETPVNPIKV